MAYTNVDRVNGRTIRKLHSPDKSQCFGYLSGVRDNNDNLSDVQKHDNLTEARNACGFKHSDEHAMRNALKNRPKSSYAQNRAGYDPHANR